MMQDIKKREEKMKQKRLNTPFRDFVKEICSWKPFVLHKNNGLISKYPAKTRTNNIITPNEFEKIRDNLPGINYDFQKGFFENFKVLYNNVPFSSLLNFGSNENADYADGVFMAKNIYLSIEAGEQAENILYSAMTYGYVNNIINSFMCTNKCENIARSSFITEGFNIFYSKYVQNSANIRFSSNLIGCKECLFCDNLQNKSYCIMNKQLEKDEYLKKKKELLSQKILFNKRLKKINQTGINRNTTNSTGTGLFMCDNVKKGYFCNRLKDSKQVILCDGMDGMENCYDCFHIGVNSDNFYGINAAGLDCHNLFSSVELAHASNIYYSYFCDTCSYCLGCIGLKNKSFCILNKQYTKEERFDLASQIFTQMDEDGILGDFFPGSLNPFYFNDTAAYLIDDTFTKEEVEAEGYLRRDDEIKVDIPEGSETVKSTELDQYQGFNSDGKREIDASILKKVIIDEKGNYYRIVKMEYDFLMKHRLPLPTLHWLDRIKLGFKFN